MNSRKPADLPYHLRSPRLRWAALAIDLAPEELELLENIVADPLQPETTLRRARLLLGLHHRQPIGELCQQLHMDRRTLFRVASTLTDPRQRHHFLEATHPHLEHH